MKLKLLFLFFFSVFCLNGQKRFFSLGTKSAGICFGGSKIYNGLRFNFIDKTDSENLNGIIISGIAQGQKRNGLSISLIGSYDRKSNGINISTLYSGSEKHNGIIISGLFSQTDFVNGIVISGFGSFVKKVNGIAFGLVNVGQGIRQEDSCSSINGIAVASIAVVSNKINGVSVSTLNEINQLNGVSFALINHCKKLHGVQFGLINYAGNNRRLFRWLPFVNFNFKKASA